MFTRDDLLSVLRKYWGYDSFRPLQEDIIFSALSGRDTLGLMPTGGGKSITFQVPGLLLGSLTVVVTPLISLMKDQVDALRRRRIQAVCFHAGMNLRETRLAWEKLVNGRARFLYISPERLANRRFVDELRHLDISLIVVDEAHCISQWGYDFRPSYLGISVLRKAAPEATVMALTATATPRVAEDICERLGFREGFGIFRKSFARDNISYIVRHSESKIADTCHILQRTSGSSIVYVRSRRRTREIAEQLQAAGISATFYHAGLDFDTKGERQTAWREGNIRVMVATNAFGMGIDKPDVRVVIHFDIPPSLEEYYQEAGRAGRDGLPSFAVILPSKTDKGVLRRRVSDAFPDKDYIVKVYERACNFLGIAIGEGYDKIFEFDFDRFCETFSLQPRQCLSALRILGRAGWLDFIEETENASRVIITVTREDLYDVHGMSQQAEKTLRALLRLYPGLFIDYIRISENTVSRETSLSPQTVYEALLELNRMGVVNYIPRSRTPYIYVPTSREEPRYVVIGRTVYEQRLEIMTRRVEAMIDYVFSDSSCRVGRMLAYFGEEDASDCRRCDVCRSRRNVSEKERKERMQQIADEVAEFINARPGGVGVRVIRMSLHIDLPELTPILSYLASEGFVTTRDNLYFPADL